MNKILFTVCSLIILGAGLLLRLYKVENRAPFDWDQNRDYYTVQSIAKGNVTLIGPVAKGEGGFFLGPLYYYLVVPAFLLLGGNPLSLPLTSIFLDMLSIVGILVLFPRVWGKWQSLTLATIWSLSWFAIEISRISWNVALVPVWTVVFIYVILGKKPHQPLHAFILGVVAGVSWHIHASLIPLAPLVLAANYKKISLKNSWLVLLGYLLPLLPLILFDIKNSGLEHTLIIGFLKADANIIYPWLEVLVSVISRFGKNCAAIVTGSSDLRLIVGTLVTATAGLAILRGSKIAKIGGIVTLANIALTIYLREPGFPEYYLAASYIPMVVIGVDWLFHLPRRLLPVIGIAMLLFSYQNLSKYSTAKSAYSLGTKRDIAIAVKALSTPVRMQYDLPLGRSSGILPLLLREGVAVSENAPTTVVISESTAESIFINGELASDLGWFGGMRVGYLVVQSK